MANKAKQNKLTAAANQKTKGANWRSMTTKQLKELHEKLTGKPIRSNNKPFLLAKIEKLIEQQDKIREEKKKQVEKEASTKAKKQTSDSQKKQTSKSKKGKKAEKSAKERVEPLPKPTQKKTDKPRDPRLPLPGTFITKKYKGAEHRVKVLHEGFEYKSEHFRSLSKLAKHISGTTWNGFLFFHCALREAAERAQRP